MRRTPLARLALLAPLCLLLLTGQQCQEGDNGEEESGLPTSGSEPAYGPGEWGDPEFPEGWTEWDRDHRREWLEGTEEGQRFVRQVGLQFKNNCYNYACNKKHDPDDPTSTHSRAEIGRAGNYDPPNGWCRLDEEGNESPTTAQDPLRSLCSQDMTCDVVKAAAAADGLTEIDCERPCPAGSYKKALVLNPVTADERADTRPDGFQTDWHWFRQDSDGKWSHKRGENKPTRESMGGPDGSGRGDEITDPREASARDGYTEFCACFCCGPQVQKAGFDLPLRFLAVLALQAVAPSSTPPERGIEVVRLLFCGKRNPSLRLTDPQQIANLAGKLDNLPEIPRPDWWPVGGDRGYLLVTLDLEILAEHGFFPLIQVYRGVIEMEGRFYRDVAGVEEWVVGEWPGGAEAVEL